MLPPYIVKTKILSRTTIGMALFPFILINKTHYESWLKNDPVKYNTLINHERIHIRQQLECFIIPFFLLYGLMWFINILKYPSGYTAYKNIAFEKEAYLNEKNLEYLKDRKLYSWIK
jgi:hypothetical protein